MEWKSETKYQKCQCKVDLGFSLGCYCTFDITNDGTLELSSVEVVEYELRCPDCQGLIKAKDG